MSAYYYDDIPTIQEKQRRLVASFDKHVTEVLTHCRDEKAMAMEMRFTRRSPASFVRRKVTHLCNAARSWAYDDGTDVFGGEASKHAKAMRACLIVEMNIWRAALRKLTNKSGN